VTCFYLRIISYEAGKSLVSSCRLPSRRSQEEKDERSFRIFWSRFTHSVDDWIRRLDAVIAAGGGHFE
jgi:hypothetical protein